MEALEVEFTLHPLRPNQPVMRITCGGSVSLVEIGQDQTGKAILTTLNELSAANRPVIGRPEGHA